MSSSIARFILEMLLERVPLPKLPDALTAILPVLAEFAQADAVLSDRTRVDIQVKVVQALRAIGLEGKDV